MVALMNKLVQLKDTFIERFNQIKGGNVSIGSIAFLEIVIAFSFIPVIVAVGMLLATLAFHYSDEWPFRIIDTSMKAIDHIWSAQLVAGVLAYSRKLKDTNKNGIPDDYEDGKS